MLPRLVRLVVMLFLSSTVALAASNAAIDLLEGDILARYKDTSPAAIIQVLGAPNGTAEREGKEFLTWESNKQAGYYGTYGGGMESYSCKATFEFADRKLVGVSLLGTHGGDRSLCKKLVKPLLSPASSAATPVGSAAQEPKSVTKPTQQTVLTNDDVIKLTRAGISDAVIVTRIKSSKCKFDLSTDALIALREAGVSNPVIEAMVSAGSE